MGEPVPDLPLYLEDCLYCGAETGKFCHVPKPNYPMKNRYAYLHKDRASRARRYGCDSCGASVGKPCNRDKGGTCANYHCWSRLGVTAVGSKQPLILRDGLVCQGCGLAPSDTLPAIVVERLMEIDHLRPRSKGGSDTLENLILLCGGCNRVKGGNKTLDELRRDNERLGAVVNKIWQA